MRNIRLIALDLDNTLLMSNKTVSEGNAAALQQAADAGICPVIASGRPFGSLPLSVLDIDCIRYAVVSNGAAVYDLHEEKRIFHSPLSSETVIRILELFPDLNSYEVVIDGHSYLWEKVYDEPEVFGATHQGAAYLRATRTPIADIRSFTIENADRIDALDILTTSEEQDKVYFSVLADECPEAYVTSSVRGLVEISSTAGGKCHGLRYLSSLLNIDAGEIMAFGDERNDIDMLQFAGIGVAMGNAENSVKESADLVTLCADDDGVAHMINNYLEGKI